MRREAPTLLNQDQSEKACHGVRRAPQRRGLVWVFTARHGPRAHSRDYLTFPCFLEYNSKCNFVSITKNYGQIRPFPTYLVAINVNIVILAAAFITSIKES